MAAKKKATEEVKAALPLEELAVTEEKPSAPSRTRKAVKKVAEERPEWEERPVALKEQAPEKQQKQASEDEHKAVLEKKESEAPAAKAPRKRSGKKPAQEKKAEEALAPAEEEPVPPAAEEAAAEKAEKTEKLRAEKELSEQQKAEEWEKMLVKRAELKLKNIADCKNELDIQKDRMMLEIDNRTETLAEEFVTGFLSMAEKI